MGFYCILFQHVDFILGNYQSYKACGDPGSSAVGVPLFRSSYMPSPKPLGPKPYKTLNRKFL